MGETAPYVFKPHERPTLPGSPANPDHPARRRFGYLAVGAVIGLTSGLGNALIQVNLNFIQGSLSLYSDEAAWLTAAYYMPYVTANLVLVKYRQQFGLQPFVRIMLALYATSTILHLTVHGFGTAILVRSMSGLASAGLTTIAILYFLQGMTAEKRLVGGMIGISIPQLATPLARAISPSLLEWGDWRMAYWFELGLALTMLAAVMILTLPPSERSKAFEKVDALTIALLAPGLCLLVAVLTQGRIYWWTDTPWLGWALAGSVALIAAALMVEHGRSNPLIVTRWLTTRQIVRLMLAAAIVRLLLSEQAFGSIGLLGVAGLISDQFVMLHVIICLAGVAGMIAAVVTLDPANLVRPFAIAALLIAIGAWLDSGATNLTRPENLYLSQALIGFAAIYFIGPALLIGLARVLLAGAQHFVSFIVLFNLSQSLGGLAGSAFLSTFQVVREKFHSHELVQSIVLSEPLMAQRLQGSGAAVAGVVGDPVLRSAQGAALLSQQVTREANILAFNDVFLLVFICAVAAFLWAVSVRVNMLRRGEQSALVLLAARLQAMQAQQKGGGS